jgi:Flp pilus assembly protein TadD
MRMKFALAPMGVALLLAALSGVAIAVDSDPSPPVSSEHAAGKKAFEARDWNGAIKSLTAAAKRDGRNADIQNLLGYAYRNAGQLDAAFNHYNQALKLDPRHLGAHEYIGEAYLMLDNLPKAKEHLSTLSSLCLITCGEYRDLKRAVDAYEKSGGKSKPTAASR